MVKDEIWPHYLNCMLHFGSLAILQSKINALGFFVCVFVSEATDHFTFKLLCKGVHHYVCLLFVLSLLEVFVVECVGVTATDFEHSSLKNITYG